MLDYDHLHTMVSALRKKQIFFVGGPVRSGTTWLQLLLDAHPSVSCSGEAHFPDVLGPLLKRASVQHDNVIKKPTTVFNEAVVCQSLDREDVLHIFAFYIAVFLIKQSKHKPVALAIGDKTPANIGYVPLLAALFPNAKFIHIVRDGRDCAVSAWFFRRAWPESMARDRGSLDAYVGNFAATWAADLVKAQKFAESHPNRFRRIRYEDLRADTERILAELFGFLGVKTDPSVLSHCRREGSFTKLTGGRNPGEEDLLAFFRKGVAGDWRNYLSDETNRLFRERAGDWLDLLGYD
jgi:Sulfotransferase family